MADGLALVLGRYMALVVFVGLAVGASCAAYVEEILCQAQVVVAPGGAVELHQPHLHYLVAGLVGEAAAEELVGEQVGVALGHGEQRGVAGGGVVGCGGLEEVAGVVELVAVDGVPLPALGAHPVVVVARLAGGACGVEVAVGLLGGGDNGHEAVHGGLYGGRGACLPGVAHAFEDLVDVGVVEGVVGVEPADVAALEYGGGFLEVEHAAGVVALAEGYGNGGGLVLADAGEPEAVGKAHLAERHAMDGVVAESAGGGGEQPRQGEAAECG